MSTPEILSCDWRLHEGVVLSSDGRTSTSSNSASNLTRLSRLAISRSEFSKVILRAVLRSARMWSLSRDECVSNMSRRSLLDSVIASTKVSVRAV